MFNCIQVSLAGRVLGLFPNNDAADAFVMVHALSRNLSRDEYRIAGRFIPNLPF
jgi:hypothetical protein